MSRRAACAARAAGTGRACRAHGCWRTTGPSEPYCKRHAQEIAAFSDDPRIINVATGRIEIVDGAKVRCRGRVGPAPEGVDEITAELRTIRCRRDYLRCRRAIFAQLHIVIDGTGVNQDIAQALYVARRRLERIGETA